MDPLNEQDDVEDAEYMERRNGTIVKSKNPKATRVGKESEWGRGPWTAQVRSKPDVGRT